MSYVYNGMGDLPGVSSIFRAFGMGPEAAARERAASTSPTPSQSSAPSGPNPNVIEALESQRSVAYQQASMLPPGPQRDAQLRIAADTERQIKANGGTPSSSIAKTTLTPSAPQAVNVQTPRQPSGLMQALVAQAGAGRAPSGSLFDSLQPVSVYNQASTATKVAVGLAGVATISVGLYLILRK